MREADSVLQQNDELLDETSAIVELTTDELGAVAGGPQIANDGPFTPPT